MAIENYENLSEEEQEKIRVMRAAKAVQLGMRMHANEQMRLAILAEKRRRSDERWVTTIGTLIVIVFMYFLFKDPETFFPIAAIIFIIGVIYYVWRIFMAIINF